MKLLFESPHPPNRVEVNYRTGALEHEVCGVCSSLPQPGDQVQSYEGHIFVLTAVESLGYAGAFFGVCKLLSG